MKHFFDKIDSKEPVNFDRYIKLFADKGIDISKMFMTQIKKKPLYYLTPKDINAYESLKTSLYLDIDKIDRTSAAIHGNSHDMATSFAYLLIKESIDSKIQSLFFNGSSIVDSYPVALKSKIIIIENLENFGSLLLNFKHINIDLNEYSFVFGGGNSITNEKLKPFFQQFEKILCLFDIDVGGFTMFNTLSKHHNNCEFIYPDNIINLMDKYVKKTLQREELFAINTTFQHNERLHDILMIINTTLKKLEQEIYLIEDNQGL